MTDYFKEGFQDRVDEVNKLEGAINKKITELNTIGKSGSTIAVEKEAEKLLAEYNSKVNTFREKYSSPPSDMPISVISKRKNIIEGFTLNFERLSKKYNEAKKQKYTMTFVPQGMSEDTRNQIKFMDNQQLYDHGQNMLKGQDEKIEEITKDVIQGKKKAKEIHHDVENQIVKLDNLHNNMDRLDERLVKATGKLDIYIQKSSYSKLWTVIVIEFVAFVYLLIRIITG